MNEKKLYKILLEIKKANEIICQVKDEHQDFLDTFEFGIYRHLDNSSSEIFKAEDFIYKHYGREIYKEKESQDQSDKEMGVE